MGFTITAAELIAFLTAQGYHIETGRARHGTKAVKGKHKISIPMHRGEIKEGTARSILRQAGYTPNDVMNWRR
jgi:predicted RNA binding protein YcfA (HicA-like mRNA interferase family)